MQKSLLEQAGLNKNESQLYEKLLEHGELNPPKLAELTGLSRENTYYVIKSLVEKELVEQVPRLKKKVFRPFSPQSLKSYVEREKMAMKNREKAIEAVIPGLLSLYNLTTNKPSVSFFEGILGIKKVYEDTLRDNPEEILVFRSIHDDEALGDFIVNYVRRRAKLGIKSRTLNPKGHRIDKPGDDKELLRRVRHVTASFFRLPTEISIYNNKVAIISLRKDKIGVIIESPDFAETLKMIFECLWQKQAS